MPGGPTCLSLSNSVVVISFMGFPDGSAGKESACNARNTGDVGSIPESGRSPGDGNATIPAFLPEKSHEQRGLVSYSPTGHKESDIIEWLSTHMHFSMLGVQFPCFFC